jgi:hypothetical protein
MVKRSIFLTGFLLTVLLFLIILSFNLYLSRERERAVLDKMDEILEEYEELQALTLLADLFDEESGCIAMASRLSHMDRTLWDAGIKIDRYRTITEEFMDDPFYLEQKRKFNRNEVRYFSMLKEMKQRCVVNQTVLLYFYKRKEECADCDAQSFVLTDMNREIDEELSIFSFDADLELPSISVLTQFYNVTDYPCMVIEDGTYCGLRDKRMMTDVLCQGRNLSICSE